jgi:hypothetical protein
MFGRYEVDDVRRRAAKIRQNWTASERRRRTGLPPDLPHKLRRHLCGWPSSQSSESHRLLTI